MKSTWQICWRAANQAPGQGVWRRSYVSVNRTGWAEKLVLQHSLPLQSLSVQKRWHNMGVSDSGAGGDTIKKGELKGVVKEVTGRDMIKSMASYIWPKNDNEVKTRVVAAMGLLVGAKAVNTCVPFIFSHAVDTLTTASQLSLSTPESAAATMITTTLIGYG